MTGGRTAPLGFLDRAVAVPSHICLFYYDDTELREMLRFLTVGLEVPEEATVLFGTRSRLDQVLAYLAADHARDVEADLRDGRITLVEGAPTGEDTLANIGKALDAVTARGATLIRFLGFIGWGETGWPGHDDLLRFEATVNDALASYPAIAICTYNANRLPGPLLIFGGIETHPITIVGQTVAENPHYVPPKEFLARPGGPWNDARRESLSNVRLTSRRDPDAG
ncbi:MAG TPA: MEDS domain-containing protein [Gaiellaceae bacterium]|nr:MEDS domain-containing protein [Gaiellaceae bacterium]